MAELLAGSATVKRMEALWRRAIGKILLAGALRRRAIGKMLLAGGAAEGWSEAEV